MNDIHGMTPGTITYFGYGSLVNRDTRPPDENAKPAFLRGWQRDWGHRVSGNGNRTRCCSLSINPCSPDSRSSAPARIRSPEPSGDSSSPAGAAGIAGVVVSLPVEHLPVLDARESGYERLVLPASDFDLPPELTVDVIHVYRSLPGNRHRADAQHPILQSYIDCVLAGYLNVFGDAGLAAFLGSTSGWNGPIENDRDAPRYPRAVSLPMTLLHDLDERIQRTRADPT